MITAQSEDIPAEDFLAKLFSLKGRVALCTGASSGIGLRMAQTLARAGASIVLTARRQDLLKVAREGIVADGGKAEFVAADLQDESQIEPLAVDAEKFFGAPDILVNAAGINLREPADQVSESSWSKTLNVNLMAPFFLARACIPHMKSGEGGNIINVASLQTFRAFPDSMPYGASKAGIAQLTRAMAEEWSRYGIAVNAIAPGFFKTDLTRAVFDNPDALAGIVKQTASGRVGELSDLDAITILLASRSAAYLTGQTIAVDGGFTAK